MKEPSVKLTREELYKEVWSTPIHRLSEKYGLSDVGLAKACKRMDIPRPPRGYWRRKETGAKVKKASLRKAKESTQMDITFYPDLRRTRKPNGEGGQRAPEFSLKVEEHLFEPHPFVELSLQRLSNARTDMYGCLASKAKKRLDLHVSAGHLNRALRIMDAIFKAWEGLGYEVEIEADLNEPRTFLRAGEERLGISIEERVREVELGPTEEEKLLPKWKWVERTEFQLTGLLVCKLRGDLVSDATRYYRKYQDGSKLSLESRAGKVISAALEYLEKREAYVEFDRQRRVAWEEADRLRRIERARLEEERRKEEEAEQRVSDLLEAAEEWEKSERLRAYIGAAREAMVAKGRGKDEIREWVRWASSVANKIDPLVK